MIQVIYDGEEREKEKRNKQREYENKKMGLKINFSVLGKVLDTSKPYFGRSSSQARILNLLVIRFARNSPSSGTCIGRN